MRRKDSRAKKTWITSRWFVITIAIIFVLLSASLIKEFFRSYKINAEINSLREEIASLESNNQEFAEFVEFLKTDLYFEEQARIKLGLKAPGEKVLILSDYIEPGELLTDDNRSLFSKLSGGESRSPNIVRWWDYFFGA